MSSTTIFTRNRLALCALVTTALFCGCDGPQTFVVIDNKYSPSDAGPPVIYQAFWQAISFQTAVLPGASSAPQSTIAASPNTAYVLLAPGWDPASTTPPTSFIVLQSVAPGFEVHLNQTLHIPVDDTTFNGRCGGSGSLLTQEQADFITQRVFASDFAGLSYDATTCATTSR